MSKREDADTTPPYTEAAVTAAYQRAVAQVDYYETEAERAAYIDAAIAMHMALCHDQLPPKYALSQRD